MSLAKIVGDRIDRIRNYDYFAIDESKELLLKGGSKANSLVYSTTIGGDELFKKLQVYTVLNNKVYLISFTSQESLFNNYLPIVQKMIDSFELRVND
jgi:serine/threonine-protein kinase